MSNHFAATMEKPGELNSTLDELMEYLSEGEIAKIESVNEDELLKSPSQPDTGTIDVITTPPIPITTAEKSTQTSPVKESKISYGPRRFPNRPNHQMNRKFHRNNYSNHNDNNDRCNINRVIDRKTDILRVYKSGSRPLPICFKCKRVGHVAKYCRA